MKTHLIQTRTVAAPVMTALCFVLFAGLATARADDSLALAVEGAFLLTQDNGSQRVIALTRGGTVSTVASGEQRGGYTSGLGTWEMTGSDSIVARIIDFNFDRDSGTPIGTAMSVYTLKFDGLEQGRYDRFSGSFAGQQFAIGQDPLNPTEPPVRSFGRSFTGQRIPGR